MVAEAELKALSQLPLAVIVALTVLPADISTGVNPDTVQLPDVVEVEPTKASST
jgi:hypothetical protein